MSDAVNHPGHYNQGKIEVLEFLEDQRLEPHEWNAVKYICRAKHKGKEIEDLEKAVFYLNRKIELLNAERERRGPVRPNQMNKHPAVLRRTAFEDVINMLENEFASMVDNESAIDARVAIESVILMLRNHVHLSKKMERDLAEIAKQEPLKLDVPSLTEHEHIWRSIAGSSDTYQCAVTGCQAVHTG